MPTIDKANAYVYKYKFLWIGWIVVSRKDDPIFYYDNTPTVYLYPQSEIDYCVLGFAKENVMKKLKKRCEKLISKGEEK